MLNDEGLNNIEEDKHDNEKEKGDSGEVEFEAAEQEARVPTAKAVAEAEAVASETVTSSGPAGRGELQVGSTSALAVTSTRESHFGGWLCPVGSGIDSAQFKAEGERIRMACLAERLAAEAGSDSQRAPLLVAEKHLLATTTGTTGCCWAFGG